MRDRGNVPYAGYHETRSLQGADCRFPPSSGALYEHVDVPHTRFASPAARLLGSALGSKCSPLAGAFEAHYARTGR